MRPPFSMIAIAYAAGVLAGSYLTLTPLVSGSAALVLLCLAWVLVGRGQKTAYAVMVVALIATGMTGAGLANELNRSELSAYANKHVVELEGVVDREPDLRIDQVIYTIRTVALTDGEERREISGLVRLTVKRQNKGETLLNYGDLVGFTAALRLPPVVGNPGEFDYRRYLARQGIYVTAYLPDSKQLVKLGTGYGNFIYNNTLKLKQKLVGVFDATLPPPYNALLIALLLGGRANLPTEIEQAFMDTGVVHILSVSGLHVGFVTLLCFALGGLLRLPLKVKAGLTILATAFYMVLTGGQPPVLRAGLMGIITMLGLVFKREHSITNSLYLAGWLILVFDPFALFDIGFQLSFAATLAIVYLTPRIEEKIRWLPGVLRLPVAVSLAAQLGVLPLTAYYFNKLAVIATIANLLVVPLSGLAVVIGFFAGGFGLLSLGLAKVLNAANWLLLAGMVQATAYLANLSFAYVNLPSPPWWGIFLYYGLLVLCLSPGWQAVFKWRFHLTAERTLIYSLVLGAAIVWLVVFQGLNPKMTVTFLDVGQGDATLITTPAGKHILVDGGGSPEGSNSGFDVGKRIVGPFLRRQGIRTLDAVILTHPHADHLGGLLAILQDFEVGMVVTNADTSASSLYHRFLEEIKARRIPFYQIARGKALNPDERVRITVLHPGEHLMQGTRSDSNNNSLVMRLNYGQVSFLLAGDLEVEGEAELLEQPIELTSTVLKVGHHGSANATGEDWLQAVSPDFAVVCVGKNSFGHPAPPTLERLNAAGIRVYRTDLHGAITFITDGKNIWVKTVRTP